MVLTDTENGDDDATLDGDERTGTTERPNVQKPQTYVRVPGLVRAHSDGHSWPLGDPLAQPRSVRPKQGRTPTCRVPAPVRIRGSEAVVRRSAVEQRDRQLPRAGAHPELRPARPDRDAERLDGVRERCAR